MKLRNENESDVVAELKSTSEIIESKWNNSMAALMCDIKEHSLEREMEIKRAYREGFADGQLSVLL